MGTTKLYQTEWNNISLVEVSKQINKSVKDIADKDFYRAFYQKLKENNWILQNDFLEEKRTLGEAVFNVLKPKVDDTIISLGAGLGICEISAIGGGYNIELQEVQPDSFMYLEKIDVVPKKKWVTYDLTDMPENFYDYAIINHVLYCFDDKQYIDYLMKVNRLLKSGGKVIITGELLSESECLKMIISNNKGLRKILGKDNSRVFWGYLRTVRRHKKLLSKIFTVCECGQLFYGDRKLDYSFFLCGKRKHISIGE